MADAPKVLGQVAPNALELTALYTVPPAAAATVSSLVVCNRGSASTFRVAVAVDGSIDQVKQYLYYDLPCGQFDTFVATVGLTLGADDVVRVQGGNSGFSFNLFGIEST